MRTLTPIVIGRGRGLESGGQPPGDGAETGAHVCRRAPPPDVVSSDVEPETSGFVENEVQKDASLVGREASRPVAELPETRQVSTGEIATRTLLLPELGVKQDVPVLWG